MNILFGLNLIIFIQINVFNEQVNEKKKIKY